MPEMLINNNQISSTNPIQTALSAASIMQPVDIQSHLATTIQTHNAVSVPLSTSSTAAVWSSSAGFSDISISITSDSGTAQLGCTILWSFDGVNTQGAELIFAPAAPAFGNSRTGNPTNSKVKGPYFKVVLTNSDATIAHTMSAWAYLTT